MGSRKGQTEGRWWKKGMIRGKEVWGSWNKRGPPHSALTTREFHSSYLCVQGQGDSGHLPFGKQQQGGKRAIDGCVCADLGPISRPNSPGAPHPRTSWPSQAVCLALPSLVLNG